MKSTIELRPKGLAKGVDEGEVASRNSYSPRQPGVAEVVSLFSRTLLYLLPQQELNKP